jgi:periplasmic protein CpxP/Spy
MSPERLDAVTTELKRIAEELSLSDSQKTQLRIYLEERHARIQEFRQQNPNISKKDLVQKIVSIRSTLREQVVRFLTPQQLEKWDAEVAKAREFLGESIAA